MLLLFMTQFILHPLYPEYTRDKRMSALDLWSLATEGRV